MWYMVLTDFRSIDVTNFLVICSPTTCLLLCLCHLRPLLLLKLRPLPVITLRVQYRQNNQFKLRPPILGPLHNS